MLRNYVSCVGDKVTSMVARCSPTTFGHKFVDLFRTGVVISHLDLSCRTSLDQDCLLNCSVIMCHVSWIKLPKLTNMVARCSPTTVGLLLLSHNWTALEPGVVLPLGPKFLVPLDQDCLLNCSVIMCHLSEIKLPAWWPGVVLPHLDL